MRDEFSIKPLGRRERQLLGRFVEQLQRTAVRIRNADRRGENFVDEYLNISLSHEPSRQVAQAASDFQISREGLFAAPPFDGDARALSDIANESQLFLSPLMGTRVGDKKDGDDFS